MGIDKESCRKYWESLQDDSGVAFTAKHDVLCLLGELAELEAQLAKQAKTMILLAKLAADKPMFFSPLIACKAVALRDEILSRPAVPEKKHPCTQCNGHREYYNQHGKLTSCTLCSHRYISLPAQPPEKEVE